VRDWRWVPLNVVVAIHDRQIAEHGGLSGLRDLGLVESALARPENLNAYAEVDAADLAAAYLHGLANNHGFADGNKRTAWVVARLFLMDNGLRLSFDRFDAIETVEKVAGGKLKEAELAEWLRGRLSAS
jgi:death on curing protein